MQEKLDSIKFFQDWTTVNDEERERGSAVAKRAFVSAVLPCAFQIEKISN